MKYQISDKTLELANAVAKNRLLKMFLRPFYYSYKQHLSKKKNIYFQKNALRVLDQFDQALNEGGFFYTLAFGTLLGAIREKGFIRHDVDIDVFMWIEDYSQDLHHCLYNHGFQLLHSFEVDDGMSGREETYIFEGITIDVFFIYPAIDKYSYCCDFLAFPDTATFPQSMKKHGGLIARRIEMPFCKERIKAPFEDRYFYVPKNAEELLKFRYGKDYLIPNPNWDIKSCDNHIITWDGKLGIFRNYFD